MAARRGRVLGTPPELMELARQRAAAAAAHGDGRGGGGDKRLQEVQSLLVQIRACRELLQAKPEAGPGACGVCGYPLRRKGRARCPRCGMVAHATCLRSCLYPNQCDGLFCSAHRGKHSGHGQGPSPPDVQPAAHQEIQCCEDCDIFELKAAERDNEAPTKRPRNAASASSEDPPSKPSSRAYDFSEQEWRRLKGSGELAMMDTRGAYLIQCTTQPWWRKGLH